MFVGNCPLHLFVLCQQQLLTICGAPCLVLTIVVPLVVILYLSQPESISQKVSRRLHFCFVCYQETKYALPLASATYVGTVHNATRAPYQFQSLGGCKRQDTLVVVCFPTLCSEYIFRYGDVGKAPRTS